MLKKQYYLTHSQIDVYFKQSKDDFVVTEIPLYEFSGDGEHLILKMRKKDLSTWDALEIIARDIGCKTRDIGCAGLKDKNALTVQYISIHRQYEEKLDNFSHSKIKFIEKTYHNNKIKTGHLKGNKFFIRLKRVQPMHRMKIESALEKIATFGIPNYFGFQRFGNYGDNYLKGKDIIDGKLKERKRNLKQMYINAYQSYLFNSWLSKRVEIGKLVDSFEAKDIAGKIGLDVDIVKELQKQKHPFKILKGDLFNHYPYGKLFYVEDTQEESEKFFNHDRVPTGLLAGSKTKLAIEDAQVFEKDFIEDTKEGGSRRFAWIFPSDISSEYKEEKAWFELSFELPKGSYATEVISELLHI